MAGLGSMSWRNTLGFVYHTSKILSKHNVAPKFRYCLSQALSAKSTRALSSYCVSQRRLNIVPTTFYRSLPNVTHSHCASCGVFKPSTIQNTFYSTSPVGSQPPKGKDDELLKSDTQEPEQEPKNIEETNDNEKSKNEEKKDTSWFSSKHAWKMGIASLGVFVLLGYGQLLFTLGPPIIGEDGEEMEDEFSSLPKWKAYPKRVWKEFGFFKKMIIEPTSQKLLPDPLKEPWYPPYTLVLELTGVLVHPDWTLATGWRFKKRPHVEEFLQKMAMSKFEVVIYTHEPGMTAYPIVNGLDPQGFITFRLFRDATRYEEGVHIKDLDCLNRDLSKVIIVDCDPKGFKLNTKNGVLLKKWKGNDDDKSLLDLANFLQSIAMNGVEDVRTVLEYYSQFDDPLEAFKENQRQLQLQQVERSKAKEKNQSSLVGQWSSSLTGRRR